MYAIWRNYWFNWRNIHLTVLNSWTQIWNENYLISNVNHNISNSEISKELYKKIFLSKGSGNLSTRQSEQKWSSTSSAPNGEWHTKWGLPLMFGSVIYSTDPTSNNHDRNLDLCSRKGLYNYFHPRLHADVMNHSTTIEWVSILWRIRERESKKTTTRHANPNEQRKHQRQMFILDMLFLWMTMRGWANKWTWLFSFLSREDPLGHGHHSHWEKVPHVGFDGLQHENSRATRKIIRFVSYLHAIPSLKVLATGE